MSPMPTDLDDRWVAALRTTGAQPDLDAAWTAVQQRVAAPRPGRDAGRRRWLAAVAALVVVGLVVWRTAATGPDREGVRAEDPPTVAAGEWERLPDMPIPPRLSPTTFAIGDEVFVIGGTSDTCTTAHCPPPSGPGRVDGAVLDLSGRTWRRMAPAPLGLHGERAVVAGGDAYVPVRNAEEAPVMLHYDPAADAWDELPAPPGSTFYSYDLVAVGDRIVAVGDSDRDRAQRNRDTVFDPAAGAWSVLPERPGPDLSTYETVAVEDDVVVVGIRALGVGSPEGLLALRLDLDAGRWSQLPADDDRIPTLRGPWVVAGDRVASVGDRRVLDLGTGTWSALPMPPDGGSGDVGAIGTAGFVPTGDVTLGGPVFDLAASRRLRIPRLPGVTEEDARTVVGVGRDVVALGGSRILGPATSFDDRDVEMLTDVWIWRAPPD